jgi:hypothetical protein
VLIRSESEARREETENERAANRDDSPGSDDGRTRWKGTVMDDGALDPQATRTLLSLEY